MILREPEHLRALARLLHDRDGRVREAAGLVNGLADQRVVDNVDRFIENLAEAALPLLVPHPAAAAKTPAAR